MTSSRPAPLRRLTTVFVGAGLALALSACGSDAEDIADDDTSSTPTDATSESSPPEPTEPTESATTTSGDTIDGDGYTYAIPEGWEDVGEEAATAQADSAVRVTDAGGFGTNINVIVAPAPPGGDDIESLREQFQQQIEGMVDTKVEALENITVDGETAIGQTASADQQGQTLIFTQYFVPHDGNLYAITLTAPEDNAEEGRAALDSVVSSWAWE